MQEDLSQRHFGHGQTVAQVERIRDIQAGKIREAFKTVKANRLDTIKDRYVLDQFGNYEVVEHERGFYHIYQEARLFDQTTGTKMSTGTVQTYSVQTFAELERTKAFKAFTHVIILHDPTIKEEPKKEVPKMPEAGDSFANDDLAQATVTAVAPAANADDLNQAPPPKKVTRQRRGTNQK